MHNLLYGSLIDYKPTTIQTVRNPSISITLRIETWVSRNRPKQSNDSLTEIPDVYIVAPVGSDLRYGDQFVDTDGRFYEILQILPHSDIDGMMQMAGIIRD